MFEKKKKNEISVVHFEGLSDFQQDYPCKLLVTDESIIITKVKPEVSVTLPRNKINSITALEEPRFMLMYHGDKAKTNKFLSNKKYYLVISYDEDKRLAFWGTSSDYGKFIELQYFKTNDVPKSYTL